MELIRAIRDGDYDKTKASVSDKEEWLKSINTVDADGMTVLHHACKKGDTKIAKLIISKLSENFDVNTQEKENGYTPLILSLYSQDDGGPEIVEALLERGADPNVEDLKGNSALHHAAANSQGDVLELLLKMKKALINLENQQGETPLHVAIRESQMWSFQLLMKSKANLNAKNKKGEGLMHYASIGIGNAVHYITYLHKEGVSLNEKDALGQTPLLAALRSGKDRDHRVVQTLLSLGADPNIADNQGISPYSLIQEKKRKGIDAAYKKQKGEKAVPQEENKVEEAKKKRSDRIGNCVMLAYFFVPLIVIILAKVFEKHLMPKYRRGP